jgi:hypothetical protein
MIHSVDSASGNTHKFHSVDSASGNTHKFHSVDCASGNTHKRSLNVGLEFTALN